MLAGPPPGRLLDPDEAMYKFVKALPEVCCYAADTADHHAAMKGCDLAADLINGNVAAQVLG